MRIAGSIQNLLFLCLLDNTELRVSLFMICSFQIEDLTFLFLYYSKKEVHLWLNHK